MMFIFLSYLMITVLYLINGKIGGLLVGGLFHHEETAALCNNSSRDSGRYPIKDMIIMWRGRRARIPN